MSGVGTEPLVVDEKRMHCDEVWVVFDEAEGGGNVVVAKYNAMSWIRDSEVPYPGEEFRKAARKLEWCLVGGVDPVVDRHRPPFWVERTIAYEASCFPRVVDVDDPMGGKMAVIEEREKA